MVEVLSQHVRSLNTELKEMQSQGWQVNPADLSEARQSRLEYQLEAVRNKFTKILLMSK